MRNYIIQKLILPDSNICDVKEMFFRSSSARYDEIENAIIAEVPSHIDLHTYFNLIPIQHYNEFLDIVDLKISINFEGRAEIAIYQNQPGYADPKKIKSLIIDSDDNKQKDIDFGWQGLKGYLYIIINTHSSLFKLIDIELKCFSDREISSTGIVCCTYRREEDVLRTIETIKKSYEQDKDTFSKSTLYIVDNDGGINLELVETNFLKHLKNSNLGGAGGFTRGILQCHFDAKTHVILLDDDILSFGEIVRRTIVLLSLMKNPKMGVHGCMLENEFKTQLHEAGEFFDLEHRLHINMHYGKNMTVIDNVKAVQYESFGNCHASNMFGWWFTAFPMSIFEKIGYPLPLFVSGDDLEFSLRSYAEGFRAFISPVVSVWHPSHMSQHSPLRIFFITRNRISYAPAHTDYSRVKKLINIALLEAKHFALTKRYATSDAMCLAIEEYLRGPVWFNESLSDWLPKLRWTNREKVQSLYFL